MVPSNSRNGATEPCGTCHMLPRCALSQTPSALALCHPSRAGTLSFAVPRSCSSVHDNVHRYDDIHSEAVHAGADEVCQGFDSDGLALVLLLLSLGSRWGSVLML